LLPHLQQKQSTMYTKNTVSCHIEYICFGKM